MGEALKLVDPVGTNGLDGGLLPAGPFKGGRGGEAAVGGALHGFGELESNEVAEALAVLEAEVVGVPVNSAKGKWMGIWGCLGEVW